MTDDTNNSIDLVWGASEIAKIINRSERQAFHLCATGKIPVRKVGERYVIERSKLIAFFTGEAA